MTEEEAYKRLLNSQPENERYYETIALMHPFFSKTYYLVVDSKELIAKIPTGEIVTFEPASIKPTNAINSNDLDQLASFTIGDIQNILDDELALIPEGNQESPVVGYSIYHSNFLDSHVEYTEYEINSVSQKKGAFTIKCGVPDLNSDECGEIYDLDRFPMLRTL